VQVGRQTDPKHYSTKCSVVRLGKIGSHLQLSRISWPLVGRYNPSSLPATTVVTGRYYEEYRSRATNLRVLLKMSLHYFPISAKIFRVVRAIRFL
jgi:hypothetical protein